MRHMLLLFLSVATDSPSCPKPQDTTIESIFKLLEL